MLILTGFLLLLALLKAELSVVHELANGGDGLGRDLDKIQALLIRNLQGLLGTHDAQLLTFSADESDLLVENVLIQFMHLLSYGRSTSF